MSSKCPHCNKTVYHAERQTRDGKDYHGLCLQKILKEEKPMLIGAYPGDESRVAGQLARKTPAEEIPVSTTTKSCPGCSAAVSVSNKFCSECGFKFE